MCSEADDSLKNTAPQISYDESMLHEAGFIVVTAANEASRDKANDFHPDETIAQVVGRNLKKGTVVLFEYYESFRTSADSYVSILENESGLKHGVDFSTAFFSERIDPRNKAQALSILVKIILDLDDEASSENAAKKNKIMVSVVCTAYNHERYIRQTLESFASQKTDFYFEILVNDDASTDKTADEIRKASTKYPELIKPTYQKVNQYSQGVDVLGMMFEKAKGKYIAICEGDDYWTDPKKLQKQVDWIETHPEYSACVHNSWKLNCKNDERVLYNQAMTKDGDIEFKDVVGKIGSVYHLSSLVARREYLVNLPDFYRVSMQYNIGDHPIGIWLSLNGKIRYLAHNMSVYRLFSCSIAWSSKLNSNQNILKWLEGSLRMLEMSRKYVNSKDMPYLESAIRKYQWEQLQALGEYAKMKQVPYDELYRKASFTQRAWISFKQYFPRLFCLYLRMQGREASIPEKLKK